MYLEHRKVGPMKNNKKERKISVVTILFYIASIIFLCIAAFSIWQSYKTVKSYQTQYTLLISDILNIYFSGSAQHFASAFFMYGIGTVLAKINALEIPLTATAKVEVEEEDEAIEFLDFENAEKPAKNEEIMQEEKLAEAK